MPARPLRPGSFSVGPAATLGAWLVPLASLVAACNAETSDDGFNFATESNGTAGSGSSSEGTTGATTGGGTTDVTTAPADSGSSTGGSESSTGELPVVPCTGVDLVFVLDD